MKLDGLLQFDYNNQEYQALLASQEKRKALAKVVLRIFDLWDLNTATQLMLLGLGPKSRALLPKYREGSSPIAGSQDTLQRVG